MQATGVGVGLHRGVVEAGPGAHQGALDRIPPRLGVFVEFDGPQGGRAIDIGQQARAPLGQDPGVQRHGAVGEVEGLAAGEGFPGERPVGRYERGDIGDGVVQEKPGGGALEIQRLIQIHGAGRVDGDQRNVTAVRSRPRERVDRVAGLRDGLGRIVRGQSEFGSDGAEVNRRRHDPLMQFHCVRCPLLQGQHGPVQLIERTVHGEHHPAGRILRRQYRRRIQRSAERCG